MRRAATGDDLSAAYKAAPDECPKCKFRGLRKCGVNVNAAGEVWQWVFCGECRSKFQERYALASLADKTE